MTAVAAVDLGATSGRVMLGHVGHNELRLQPVARFPNGPTATPDGLRWDVTALYKHVLTGLANAVREWPDIASVGVDSWAVDYGLIARGELLAEPFHYRDDRNTLAVPRVHGVIGADELYSRTGLQHLPFNTLFQLTSDAAAGTLITAESFLLVPDLLNFWLTGVQLAERTNASTTGLLDPVTREWDDELIGRLGLPRTLFPELVDAGVLVGGLRPELRDRVGADLKVVTVASHDTASAVVAIPATDEDFAYISCGTWGLVGVELDEPVISEAGRAANFTNEGGLDGRVRYLHNVMGLWLLSESVRTWEERDGEKIDLTALLDAAAAVASPVALFDANAPEFSPPGDMPARIAEWCRVHDQPVPRSKAEFTRSIIESLAHDFAAAVRTAGELSGRDVRVIHLVGGGSLNTLLCQLTADRSGLPVHAGPVEATAIGNILVQARATGLVTGDIESLRALVARHFAPVTYLPSRTRSTTKGTSW
jgi:rhamnulokinase